MAERMISQVKLYYKQIKEKFDETKTVTLNLGIDPQIQCVLAQGSDSGRVICRKKPESLPISTIEKPLKECQVEMGKIVEIKGPNCKNCMYSRVTYLQGDQIMLADYYTNRVLLLNSSYQYIASLTLSDHPCDICVVDHKEVAVSLPSINTLQFLSVTSGTMKPTRTVQTRYTCWGIAPEGRGKIVLSGNCQDKGKHYWSLISSTGEEERCHQFDCQCKPSSKRVALNSSCTRVYITVLQGDSLYCFDIDLRMVYHYRHDSLKHPRGVATDRDDNVYVVGYGSRNIHQLTSGGTPIRIISNGIPQNPQVICFNNSHDRFLLTNDITTNLYLFRFK